MTIAPLLKRMLEHARIPLLLVLLAVTLWLSFPAVRVEVEQDNRSMVANAPQRLAEYTRFRELFGDDEQLLLSIEGLSPLEPAGRQLLAELTTRIETIDGVARVWSLANASHLVPGEWGAEERPLLARENDAADIAAILEENPHYLGLLVSADHRAAAILIDLEERGDNPSQRRSVITELRDMQRAYAAQAELHLTGVGVQKSDVAYFIERDQRVLLPLVVLVLAVLLAVVFRHPSGVLLPLAVTAVSMVWTMGCYVLAGYQLNTITSLLPPVLMVISVSTSVHLYNGWLSLGGDDRERLNRLSASTAELFTPCLFTSLTTALGLVSLCISDVPAVRQFGLFAALGVCFSFVVSFTLVPVWLSFQRIVAERRRDGTGFLRRLLEGIANLTFRHPWAVVLVAMSLVGVSLAGVPTIRNNTDLVAFLKKDTPLAVDTRAIDRRFGGVNTLEFMVERRDGSGLRELDDYRRMEAFEQRLRDVEEVTGVLSLVTLLRPLQRAEFGAGELVLPANQDELTVLLDLLAMASDAPLVNKFLSPGHRVARLSVRLPSLGSRDAVELVAGLQKTGEEVFGEGYRLTATGSFHQVVSDSNGLVADMLRSFSLSLGLVMLAILVLLRSLRLTLLALIPNLVPLIWCAGVMGFAGIDLSTGTAMIGAVVIGLAVDDTIHYLVQYQRSFRGEPSPAVLETTTRTGRPLTISSLVLALGFWVGCFGSFWPTIYFSLLVGGTLIAALLCDLLVLPAVLVLNCPRRGEMRP